MKPNCKQANAGMCHAGDAPDSARVGRVRDLRAAFQRFFTRHKMRSENWKTLSEADKQLKVESRSELRAGAGAKACPHPSTLNSQLPLPHAWRVRLRDRMRAVPGRDAIKN